MSSKCDGDRDMIYGGRHLDTGHCVLLSGLGWSLVLMTGTQILVIPLPQSLESTGRTHAFNDATISYLLLKFV